MPANPRRDDLAEMAKGRAARLFKAWTDLQGREGAKVTLSELGERIGRAEGRGPYDASGVRNWIYGMAEPRSLATWTALGHVLGVDPAYLAFGVADDDLPPVPTLPQPRRRAVKRLDG